MTTTRWALRMLGRWELSDRECPVKVGRRQQRLIAFVALEGARPRPVVAEQLWPERAEGRSNCSLRVALWHIQHELPGLLRCEGNVLCPADLTCDVAGLLRRHPPAHAADLLEQWRDAVLLPGWYDDWLLPQQERLATLRLNALDDVAAHALLTGEPALAIEAASLTVAAEPLREHSLWLLIQAHLRSGNTVQAARTYQRLATQTHETFGQAPSFSWSDVVASAMPDTSSALVPPGGPWALTPTPSTPSFRRRR